MKLSKLIQFCAIAVVCSITLPSWAQETLLGLPPLHVDGKYFKDEQGNKVVLHGVMDTPSMWFNGYGPWNDHHSYWEGGYNSNGAANCIAYFKEIFTAITDHESGAYCNIFRLHLDPAWTNNSNINGKVDDREKYYKEGNETKAIDGEADFSHYSGTNLTNYLNTLYFPLAQSALKHGMYVIMRPPGVCPPNIYVGGTYQKYLLNVWKRVSSNDSIQKYCGQISLELANEPINVYNEDGSSGPQALHDFFQPIVDQIRECGFKGIILVPGTGYQSNYRDYVNYPITGDNIGYAVHDYAGWYGTSDDSYDTNNAIKQFGNQVPVVKTNPIVITEVDWSPKNSSNIKNYNEFGQPVYGNYGTWATASTSKWGKAYKAILEHYGNISMTLTSTADYIDINDYLYNNKKVTPAFKTAMEQNQVDPYEACGVACFDWYGKYFQVNYPSLTRYQPLQQYPEDPFELSQEWFKPSIIQQGGVQHTASYSILTINKGGLAGWSYEDGIDLSSYKTLVVKLKRTASKNTCLRIYDAGSLFGDCYELDLGGEKEFEFSLHNLMKTSGEQLDPSHIRFVGFTPLTTNINLYVEKVFLSTEETAIDALEAEVSDEEGYVDLMGRPVENPTSGIYIRRSDNKKVYIK